MITNFENYIKESPDYITYKDNEYNYDDDDAKPFFITVNKDHTEVKKLYVGDYGDIHSDIKHHYDSKVDKSYPGRIWRKGKIISFWVYPNPVLFKSIIKKLESRLRLKIFNNNWLIEIRKENDGSFQIANLDSNKNFFFDRKYGDTEVIPIEDYIGSLDQPEEEKLWHLMNAEEKRIAKLKGKAPDFRGWGSDMTAWDGPNPLWWRQAKYQENFNTNNINKLNESPDRVNYGDVYVHNGDYDARPFAIVPNDNHTKVDELYIGGFKEYHGTTKGTGYMKDTTISDKDQIVSAYPGRIWTDSKIISFWTYPNEILFKDIIKNLEKKLNIKIFNNGWMIEIRKSENDEIIKKEFDPNEKNKGEFYFGSNDDYYEMDLVPIEDYIGSLDQPEEEKLWHLMNAEEKRIAKLKGKAPDFRGWGSDMTAWDGPNPLWWRQAKYQENMTNESPDYFTFTDKNGKKKQYIFYHNQARPFIFDVNKDHTEVEKVYLGKNGGMHSDIKHGKNSYDRGGRKDEKCYPGRLWRRRKIINFWVYPNEKLFVSMIKMLEKELNIKMFNNGWKIEIIKDQDGIVRKNDKNDKFYNKNYYNKREFISIEDYAGSANQPEEKRLWHLMNAEEKRIAKLKGEAPDFRGWGSDMTAWDGPNPLWWRQAKYQENKKFNDN